jgi:hypothetical protein
MPAEGKITADEAEQLIAALDREQPDAASSSVNARPMPWPKYLRVVVDSTDNFGGNGPAASTSGCHCNCCGPAYGWPA